VAERFVVPLKRVCRWREGASVQTDAIRGEGTWGELGNLSTPGRVQDLQLAVARRNKGVRSVREPDSGNLHVRSMSGMWKRKSRSNH